MQVEQVERAGECHDASVAITLATRGDYTTGFTT